MALAKAAVLRFGPMAKRAGFALIAVFLVFSLTEVLLRIFDIRVQSGDGGRNDRAFYFSMKQGVADIDTHLVLGVRILPLAPGEYRIRSPLQPKAPGSFRLLCLGDSSTYGQGVEANETYCAQLESMLAEKLAPRPVEAVNAGYPGYTSYQGSMLFSRHQEILSPDAVVFYFGANDMIYAPVRQDKDWDAVPLWAIKTNRALYESSRLYGLLRNVNIRYILQSMVHPFNEQARQAPYRMRVGAKDFTRNLIAVKELAARSGAKTYIVPYLGKDGDRLTSAVYALDAGRPRVIELEPAFRREMDQGGAVFVDTVHPNPMGHRIIARLLSDMILADMQSPG